MTSDLAITGHIQRLQYPMLESLALHITALLRLANKAHQASVCFCAGHGHTSQFGNAGS